MVLLYTTGRYCSHSSGEYPNSWMIFICLTIVLFPDSPAPVILHFNKSNIVREYDKIKIEILRTLYEKSKNKTLFEST